MKVGILTLHDSINYGALLQAYAMAKVYKSLGHDAVLIDRRRNPLGWPLKWELAGIAPLKRLAWFLNATGVWHESIRRKRTLDFLRNRIGMTPYHFQSWSQVPDDLGVDLVSVGSDQVWNCGINDPLDYMAGRITGSSRKISYAASVGASEFPDNLCQSCKDALAKFDAVSVREATSVDLLKNLGIEAKHVVDPVVLAGRRVWDELTGDVQRTDRIVIYLLGIYLPPIIEELIEELMAADSEVDLYVGAFVVEPLTRHNHPRLFKNLKFWRRCRRNPRLHIHLSDGPESFVRSISASSAVITNSYHALLFSVLYGRNVRYVLPDSRTPQHSMMVRIRDYSDSIISGPLFQDSVKSAWQSIASGETTAIDQDALEQRRQDSLAWLKGAL